MNANWGLRDFSAGSQIESAGYGFALRLLWDWFLFNTSALSGPQSHRKMDPHCHKWNTLMAHYLSSESEIIHSAILSLFWKKTGLSFCLFPRRPNEPSGENAPCLQISLQILWQISLQKYLIIMFCVSAVKSYKCTEQQSWEIKPCLLLPWFFFFFFS